jgi:hypothetical protein
MSSGLEEILENTFEGCCSLQAVSIPETVYWIGDRAFNFCVALVSVELPTTIDIGMGEGVFNMCKNLVNIVIPENTSNVEESAFVGCTLLKREYVGRQVTEALKERFEGFPIHKLCYHASSTTEEELVLVAKSTNGTNLDDLVDAIWKAACGSRSRPHGGLSDRVADSQGLVRKPPSRIFLYT